MNDFTNSPQYQALKAMQPLKPADGGPAFPYREQDGAGGFVQHPGISMRDWFASKALEGLLASDVFMAKLDSDPGCRGKEFEPMMAAASFFIADAMLVARDRKEGK